MIKNKRSNSGLSFIELLFTISILGIIMISIVPLCTNTNKINNISESLYKATLLAQEYMEQIKASDSVTVGQTIDCIDDTKILVDIEKIDKYNSDFYQITIEVFQKDELMESIKGYKIITN
ncbi:MAG: hypothetical protein WDA24_06805 [Tissierellales bacterium]